MNQTDEFSFFRDGIPNKTSVTMTPPSSLWSAEDTSTAQVAGGSNEIRKMKGSVDGIAVAQVLSDETKDIAKTTFADVMKTRTQVTKSQLSSLFTFDSEVLEPDVSLVIDLMLKAQSPATTVQSITLLHRIYMLESMSLNMYEK